MALISVILPVSGRNLIHYLFAPTFRSMRHYDAVPNGFDYVEGGAVH
jgi:hypothetical protein